MLLSILSKVGIYSTDFFKLKITKISELSALHFFLSLRLSEPPSNDNLFQGGLKI